MKPVLSSPCDICGCIATMLYSDIVEYEDSTGHIVFRAYGDTLYSRCEKHISEPVISRKKLNKPITTKEEYNNLVSAIGIGDLSFFGIC